MKLSLARRHPADEDGHAPGPELIRKHFSRLLYVES
jgi:hypothetical protein